MKLSFQQRLVGSFVMVFALFMAGIVVFEHGRVRRYKTEALTERLDAYAGQIGQMVEGGGNAHDELTGARSHAGAPGGGEGGALDSLIALMPPELRVTLIDPEGRVTYDNTLDTRDMDNHSDRPEIAAARTAPQHRGTSIRTSESSGTQYLYYARAADGGGGVVRVALPYDVRVRLFLRPDHAFLYFAAALFALGLVLILYMGNYFGAAVKRLREGEAREKTRRLKREMTGNIAHELRTPVTSIRGFLEIVLGNELDEARRRQYLERAYGQTQTLSALISDMSLLARINEKQGEFRFSPVDAAALLEKVRNDTSRGLVEKNISLRVELPPGLTFLGNESLLYSVLRNLTDNVISHAGEGVGIVVSAEVFQSKSGGEGNGSGRRARVTFADNGRGIPPGIDPERIFERFYRVEEGRTREGGGSGLGLSIVRNTVALHGGTIAVGANQPRGLRFIFDLPLA